MCWCGVVVVWFVKLWCCAGVDMVLQWCCDGVAVVLQRWCYCDVVVL